MAIYVDRNLDTIRLYLNIKSVFGVAVANFLSHVDESGQRRLLGETISHTGYIIMILQVVISRIFEKRKAIPTFIFGLFVAALGFLTIGYAKISASSWVFLGIALFAIGEMIASPRIQEYITWIAPKEKAGLYMGTNFLALGIGGGLSGVVYTSLYGYFRNLNHPEYVWFVMTAHVLIGIILMVIYTKVAGEFKELEE
jgi:dipeptide/tripeptide permease